jgi:hypothetical protein
MRLTYGCDRGWLSRRLIKYNLFPLGVVEILRSGNRMTEDVEGGRRDSAITEFVVADKGISAP